MSRFAGTCVIASRSIKGLSTLWQCQWHNKRQGRKGTLWEDRYKSVLVERDAKALLTMAAYIDLN